jgi:hypothetical protein
MTMTWTLFLWLAYSPDSMTPLGWYATSSACVSAKQTEVRAAVRAGAGGGATYICLPDDREPRASTALRGK